MELDLPICCRSDRHARRPHPLGPIRTCFKESFSRRCHSRLRHWTLRRETAIKSQRLTAVVRRAVREEPRYRIGNLFGAADPAERMDCAHSVECFFAAKHVEQHFGAYSTGADSIDANSVFSVFDCCGLGQTENCMLTGDIMPGSRDCQEPADRGCVHDRAPLSL